MYIKIVIVQFLMLVLLISCGRSHDVRIRSLNKEQVYLHLDKMEMLKKQNETSPKLLSSKYRFIAYYDSKQCSQCTLLHGGIWNRLQLETCNVDYILIFCPQDKDTSDALRRAYKMMKPQQYIFLDSLGVFECDNEFVVKRSKARAFLLDSDNRIVFVGDPTKDMETQEAYLQVVDSLLQNRKTDKTIQPK